MTAAILFALGVALGSACVHRMRPRPAERTDWETACRTERADHARTRAMLQEALAAQEVAAAQVAVLVATVEGAATTQDTRRAVRLDEDVRERFCWN